MASEALTEYERRRLENIRRNDEMMASLMLGRKVSDLAATLKRAPSDTKKEEKKTKKPRLGTPVVVRRSLRHRGLPPDLSVPTDHPSHNAPPVDDLPTGPDCKPGPLLIGEALVEGLKPFDGHLIEAILNASDRSGLDLGKGDKGEGSLDPKRDLRLTAQNVRKILDGRILTVQFLPFGDRTVIVTGDKLGNVGFWDVDTEEGDGVYDGYIRLMDIREGTFNMIYSSDYLVFSLCQSPSNVGSIYFGEGSGELKLWDERAGKVSGTWGLHEQRINTIDFRPDNINMIATSSTDGTACIWDLRNLKKHHPNMLKTIHHQRAVHSAYFSPGGSCLATTSIDDRVGILRGANYDDLSMVKHDNQTGRWISSFRAIWGWDDSYLFLGNMKRAVDVISTDLTMTTALVSEHMTSIACRFAAHPCKRGSLACATAGGKVFLWTKS
ncbi:unnamed protein product [Musa textilis]